MLAIRESIRREGGKPKISPQKLKRGVGEEFAEQLPYKQENVKLKITDEVDCNYKSGEIVYGNLIYSIDVQKGGG